jgi:hypothetical protein
MDRSTSDPAVIDSGNCEKNRVRSRQAKANQFTATKVVCYVDATIVESLVYRLHDPTIDRL